ncbi:hypothetical protein ACU4GD_33845 [Cupriavidus basilensis]
MNRFGARRVPLCELLGYAALAVVLANWSSSFAAVAAVSSS